MFQETICSSSGETTVFMRYLVLVILCGWLSGMQEHKLLHTGQSSTQNNKYQVSHKHSCFSWWWAYGLPKHVDIDKYTKNKLCSKLVLFTRLYRDAQSTKHNIWRRGILHQGQTESNNKYWRVKGNHRSAEAVHTGSGKSVLRHSCCYNNNNNNNKLTFLSWLIQHNSIYYVTRAAHFLICNVLTNKCTQ